MRRDRAMFAAARGFTLIEALIALAILAIAAAALLGAAGTQIDHVGRLESRALAELAAENRLAELRLAHAAPAAGHERVVMGRSEWDVAVSPAATSDPDLVEVRISVSEIGARGALLDLIGFIDAGAR